MSLRVGRGLKDYVSVINSVRNQYLFYFLMIATPSLGMSRESVLHEMQKTWLKNT